MSYKIAVATSDGIHVDQSFGAASVFDIYTITDDSIELTEQREYEPDSVLAADSENNAAISSSFERSGYSSVEDADSIAAFGGSPRNQDDHGCGCGHGCGGASSPKVEMLSDVRCLVCSKIGFQAQKQFEKKAITIFDISGEIMDVLEKISGYFTRMDRHQSLRGWVR